MRPQPSAARAIGGTFVANRSNEDTSLGSSSIPCVNNIKITKTSITNNKKTTKTSIPNNKQLRKRQQRIINITKNQYPNNKMSVSNNRKITKTPAPI